MPFVWIAILAGKADIDMPAGVTGVLCMRETYREGAQAVALAPPALADKLIEGAAWRTWVFTAFRNGSCP